MSNDSLFNVRVRRAILRGVDALATKVGGKLGPCGRDAAPLEGSEAAADAVAVSKDNPFENLGAQLVREVVATTALAVGDGTTTAAVLAQSIYCGGVDLLAAGRDPKLINRGVSRAVAHVVRQLEAMSIAGPDQQCIAHVAALAANADTAIAEVVTRALLLVGQGGAISVEEGALTPGESAETTLTLLSGMQLSCGYLSPYFVTDTAQMLVAYNDALVLVCQGTLSDLAELAPLLAEVASSGRALVVIAEDFGSDALGALVVNKLRGRLQVAALSSRALGAGTGLLEDIAIFTGCRPCGANAGVGLGALTLADLGSVQRISMGKSSSRLVGGAGSAPAMEARVGQLRSELAGAQPSERGVFEERLQKLTGGVAVIRVGAASERERKERKRRAESSISSTRAAIEEGTVQGGGVAYVRCIPALLALEVPAEEDVGVELLARALEAPLRCIADNGGFDPSKVLRTVSASENPEHGFNVATGVYEDLRLAGIIDATKVARLALRNAASIASLMLTTEAVIVRNDLRGGVRRRG